MVPQLLDKDGFGAEWGPRTAERRHRDYNFSCEHPCTWNGPSWPFETSRLLTALANVLNRSSQQPLGSVSTHTWLTLLRQYARVQTRSAVAEPSDLEGRSVHKHPWIGEDVHPDDGYWIAREYMLRCAHDYARLTRMLGAIMFTESSVANAETGNGTGGAVICTITPPSVI